jgi:hypothetical protein
MSSDILETIEHEGYKIQVLLDEGARDPREDCDHLGTMAFYHRRYRLGDPLQFKDHNDLYEHLKETPHIRLPVYMYDHSGQTISTTPFSCPWDSGQLGVIFVTHDELKKAGLEYETAEQVDKVKEMLRNEVKEYDTYMQGNVLAYKVISPNKEEIDSCYGYYDKDHLLNDAKSIIGSYSQNNVGAMI